jgi:hypothetical protein
MFNKFSYLDVAANMHNIYLLALQSLTSAQNYTVPENFLLKSAKQVPCIHSASTYYEV